MPDFLGAVITAAAGLVGVGLGGALTLFNQRRQRADERIQQQLTEFYAPFLGIHMLIRAKSEFRLKLSGVLGAAWPQTLVEARAQGDPELLKKTADENWPAFEKAQDYANHVLQHEIVPLYNKMVQLFTDKMWLTEPSTRQHFQSLVEYVEIWNRFFADALPKVAIPLLNHDEDKVKPLYADVANHVEGLTGRLAVRASNVRLGLQRFYTVLALIWLLGASLYTYRTAKAEQDFACSQAADQGVARLSSSSQQPDGVRVQGPDGQMYLSPNGTTKTDAVSYFKQRRTCASSTPVRTAPLIAFVPAVLGYYCLRASSWAERGFGTVFGHSIMGK